MRIRATQAQLRQLQVGQARAVVVKSDTSRKQAVFIRIFWVKLLVGSAGKGKMIHQSWAGSTVIAHKA